MELTNWIYAQREQLAPEQNARAVRTLVLMLAPFAPFLAEELWERLGEPYSVHQRTWPSYDPAQIEAAEITLVVQINGKVRDRVQVAPDVDEAAALAAATASPVAARFLADQTIRRVIYVPGRLINIAV